MKYCYLVAGRSTNELSKDGFVSRCLGDAQEILVVKPGPQTFLPRCLLACPLSVAWRLEIG